MVMARRRNRRLRQILKHEQLSVKMHVAAALHHSAQRGARVDASTQTDPYAAATCAATAAPAPVFEYVAPAPVTGYIAPALAVTSDAPSQQLPLVYTTANVDTDVNLDITSLVNPQFSTSAVETSAPQVIGSPLPFEEFDAPVYHQTPVFEYAAPAPVTGYIAPAPAVTSDAQSQQLPPVYTTTTVTTDDNLDITSLMYPQFSSTAVEPCSPHVVGSLPPLEEFTQPVYNPEQIVAGEMTQNIIGNSAVQEQVIVQEIPPVVEQIQEQIVETIDNETSSTSTSSSSTSTSNDRLDALASMLDSCLEQLTPSAGLNEELGRIETLTKRLLEPPLPEPPMVEPDRASAKRRRRTRYTPLPGIMENAVYLAPNGWPPIRHA